ncbi:MAG: hypothetical protein ACP5KJ_01710 [Candidatus Micrarchaeia archaeon]
MNRLEILNRFESKQGCKKNRLRHIFAGMLLWSTVLISTPTYAQGGIRNDPICKEFAETKRAVLYAQNKNLGPYAPKFTTLDFHEQSVILSKNTMFDNYKVVEEKGRKVFEKYGPGMEMECLKDIGFWNEIKKEWEGHKPAFKKYGEKNDDWKDWLKFIITIAMLYAFLKNLKAD